MNTEQMNASMTSMTEWLAHPQELGKTPAKIECVDTFDLHEMKYYIFKYKKNMLGKWMLGVCGGYEGDELEHCGHVYSEMEKYDEVTAVKKSIEMVEQIRSYWMNQAKQYEDNTEQTGKFLGFVLLSDNSWDKEQLIYDLKEKWDITAEESDEVKDKDDEYNLIFSLGDDMVIISLMPAPIPNDEAVECAKNNYMWPEAVEVSKAHQAHILVTIFGKSDDVIEHGKIYTKVVSACCRQKNATGIYTSGVVFEPRFYEEFADVMKKGELPTFNWIWFGLYRNEEGMCAYTYGMDVFGKPEMEVLDTTAEPSQLRDFLASMVLYVLKYDATLRDGETIGFSEKDKHAITYSKGIALPDQMTLKITY